MSLIVEFLQKEIEELNENGVRIHMLGQLEELPSDAGKEIRKAMETTRRNKGLQVNIAINYGSRMEIILAARAIAEDVSRGRLSVKDIDEEQFSHYLETDGIPDPDLLIRTGGEYRLSNFLLFQSAYTELLFTRKDLYWPDFTRDQYLKALAEYQKRVRKFGGIK
jgi:undecaprenyl diphosphate synthase